MPLPPFRRVQLPPFLVVGIDHAGVQRAYDYLPYPPGEGLDAFRPEARTWPGGGVDAYLDAIFLEVRRACKHILCAVSASMNVGCELMLTRSRTHLFLEVRWGAPGSDDACVQNACGPHSRYRPP